MKIKAKEIKNSKKNKFAIWKVALITLASVIGFAGLVFLIIYLTGGFTPKTVNPENIFFADVVISEDGTKSYVNRGSNPYNVDSGFELIVSTSTEEFNQGEIELKFTKTQTTNYIMQIGLDEEVSDLAKVFYAFDKDGNRIKFVTCSQDKATHITNGIIISPRFANINTPFKIQLVVAPNNIDGDIISSTELYNVGGYTQLIATSVANAKISSTSAYINVDVPVEKIEIIGITKNGSNEEQLKEVDGYIEVSSESLFSALLQVTPNRAIYKFGKDGSNGEKQYKKVIFSLDNDVNNAGKIINFVDSNNSPIDNLINYANEILFNGLGYQGSSFKTYTKPGNVKIYAWMFSTSILEDTSEGLTINDTYLEMGTKGLSTSSEFKIKEISINGFTVTDEYNNGNPLDLNINKKNILYANRAEGDNNLGIQINSSQGSAQNNIKNILISLQYMIGNEWYDATKVNVVNGQSIPAIMSVYSKNEIVSGDGLKIYNTNKLYNFNFYRPIYLETSNLSYWEVSALPSSENLLALGISSVRIYVYYLSPDSGLVLDDKENYGPYYIETKVNEIIPPILEWEKGEFETNQDLGIGGFNDRVFISGDRQFEIYNSILIENMAKISNINSDPTYKTIRYFISTNQDYDFSKFLNVKKYNGTISGVSAKNIYEVDSNSAYLTISSLTEDQIEFNLFFAVVEDSNRIPTLSANGLYRIISLPKTLNGNLITIPFRITRALGDFNINFSKDESATINPYGTGDDRFFVLQNIKNNLILEITISNKDANLFELTAKNGEIVLSDNENLYCLVGLREVPLSEILSTIFSNPDRETVYQDIFEKQIVGENVVYKIKISTKNINFETNVDEIETNVSLTYSIFATNIPDENKQTTKESNLINIYSGKIQNGYFENNGEIFNGEIIVDKTISDDLSNLEFTITIKDVVVEDENSIIYKKGNNYYVKVKIEAFGINDGYSIISNNSSIVLLTWDEEENAYRISFLSNGSALLTLQVNYPHSNFVAKDLKITINSNYSTNAEYNGQGKDERIISYDSSIGYQILGKTDENFINFADLIQIFATKEDQNIDITSLFNFNVYYDNQSDFAKRIEVTPGVGFKITKDFGNAGNITVSASSVEIGATFNFNIVIVPNYQINASVSGHEDNGATKPEDAPAGSYGVYSEADIVFNSLTFKVYDLVSKSYSTDADLSLLKFLLILQNGTSIVGEGDINGIITFEDYAELSAVGASRKLMFNAGTEGKFILRITDAEGDVDSLDLVFDITFYVSNNIKLDTSGLEVKEEIIDGNNVEVIYLNNFENPVLNEQTISFNDNKIVFGLTQIEIKTLKEFGELVFRGNFKFELADSNGVNGITISNATKESELLLKVTYGKTINEQFVGKTFYIKLFVAPNITLADEENKVLYDGKEYVSFYPSLTNQTIKNWFTCDGVKVTGVSLGEIAPTGTILSLPRLYSMIGNVNISDNGRSFVIEKTEEGLIKTQIVVYFEDENGKQSKVFNVLITPFDWKTFINYSDGEFSKKSDIKDVLSGKFQEEMISGESLVLKDYVLGDKLGDLIGSSTTRINYKLFRVADNGQETELNMKNGWAYLDFAQGGLNLLTQPVAKDYKYRIEFTYIGQATGYEDATFVFNYYVNVLKGQKIDISYPFTDETTSYPLTDENLTIEQLLEKYQSDPNKIFETTKKHIVYYDQFVKGLYNIDLNSSLRNFNSNSPYVNVYNLANGKWVSQAQNSAMSYNKITYSLYKLFVGGTEITSNLGSFVSVSTNGKVELKLQENVMGIIIKAQTPNGSENYYLIWATPRGSETVSISEGEESQTLSMNDEITIINNFSLKKFTSNVGAIKFAIINELGKIQTSEDMIYIDIKTNSIIVKSSPNQQSAILVVYTEELGTLVEVKLIADSPIVVDYDRTKVVYGDSEILISNLISIELLQEDGTFNNFDGLSGLTYNLVSNNLEELVSYNSESKKLIFKPISEVKNLEMKFNIYGEGLSGTSEENPCSITIMLTINPRIIEKEEDKHSEIIANDGETNIDFDDVFSIGDFGQKVKYQILGGKKGINWIISGTGEIEWKQDGTYYVVEKNSHNNFITAYKVVISNSSQHKDVYPITNAKTELKYGALRTNTVTNLKSFAYGNISISDYCYFEKPFLSLYDYLRWKQSGEYMVTTRTKLGTTDVKEETYFVIVDSENNPTYYTFSTTAQEPQEGWMGENYKFKVNYSWDGGNNETITVSPDSGDLSIVNNNGLLSINNLLTVTTYNVVSTRTATIRISIYKEVDGTVVGETVVGTYTLTIKPKYNLETNYPDYGTGAKMESESVYVGQSEFFALTNNDRIVIKQGENKITDLSELIKFTVPAEFASYLSVNETTGAITITKEGKNIVTNKTVRIDIELNNGNDIYLPFGAYYLVLSPTPVLGVEFPESSQPGKTEHSETIPDTAITAGEKVFQLQDGYIKIQTKQNTLDKGIIYLELLANEKYSYFNYGEQNVKPVRVYIIGGQYVEYAKIFILENANDGEKTSSRATVTNVTDFDILGSDDDANICGIEDGVIKFYKDGLWPIKVVTNSGTNFYYVSVNNKVATYYDKIELENNALSLADIFGNINNKDMYEYVINPENSFGTDAIHSSNVVQPYSKINFFYTNGNITYKIPFSQAETYFNNINETFNLTGEMPKPIEITNKFGTVVGTYKYEIVNDYKFEDGVFDEIVVDKNGEFTSENNLSQYNQDEFKAFTNPTTKTTIQISKTLNLNAGQSYNLVEDVLKDMLGLTLFDGGNFNIENAKFKVELVHDTYITNEGFKTNKNALISLTKIYEDEDTGSKNYMITPHGAQNGGDIVHLKLTFGNNVYYLRINIVPEVEIKSLSTSGNAIINFTPSSEAGTTMNLALNKLISANSAVNASKLQVIVVSGNSAIYVQGEGNNRNTQLVAGGGNTLSNYGLILNKTALGGAQIQIIVVDEYGYQATDAAGNPVIITINYKNQEGNSVQVDLNQSSSNVYEGDTFEIWAKCEVDGEIKYFKYDYDNESWGDGQTTKPTEGENDNKSVIILENISLGTDKKPIQVEISLAESQELKDKLTGKTLLNETSLSLGYIDNTYFNNQEKITGNNFTLIIKATVGGIQESISFSVNTTINQRYKLVFKSPYDKYETLYVPNKEADDETVSKYFVLYDIKKSEIIDDNPISITPTEGFKTIDNPTFNSNGFVKDGSGTWKGTYECTVNGASITGSLQFNYQLTQKYFGVDTSQANIVGSYGVVVPGSATNSEIGINVWGNGINLVDYYGNKEDTITGAYVDKASLNPGAGQTVVVNVYGNDSTKDENILIGTIKVTRARYYDISVTENDGIAENNGILPFKDGWGNVIKAVVSGGTSQEAIAGGLSGFFSYNIIDGTAEVVYDASQGTYVINTNGSSEFVLKIKYMNIEIGEVRFDKSEDGDSWTLSKISV